MRSGPARARALRASRDGKSAAAPLNGGDDLAYLIGAILAAAGVVLALRLLR